MNYSQLLNIRRSVRDYKNKRIESDKIDIIKSNINLLEEKYSDGEFKFKFYEDGNSIFKLLNGSAGYSGVMIESPHYVGIEFSDLSKENIVKSAFVFENLMVEALKLDIGTCWISLVNVNEELKSKLLTNNSNEILYIASLGYEKEKIPFNNTYSSRLSIKDIVYKEKWNQSIDIEELETRGLSEIFFNIINAPSNRNSQPWRFIVKENKVAICIEKINDFNLIDVGIIMCYFRGMAHDIGYNIDWKLLSIDDESTNYIEVAEFNI